MCLRSSHHPATIRGIAALFGLGRAAPPISPRPRPSPAAGAGSPPGGLPPGFGQRELGAAVGGGAEGSTCRSTNTRIRTRPKRTRDRPAAGESQQVDSPSHFSRRPIVGEPGIPLQFDTRQFGAHFIRSSATCNRWHASFSFSKGADRQLRIQLLRRLARPPDIKFDYEQAVVRTASRPLQMTHRTRLGFPTAARP